MLVIKVGGAAGVDLDAVCRDLAGLAAEGTRSILVHGGSAETNRVAEALGHPPRFLTSISGYTSRYTDRTALEIMEMIYCGKINKGIVVKLQRLGVNAVGLSGIDGRLLTATRKAALKVRQNGKTIVVRVDLSGKIEEVNVDLLRLLLESGYTPVVCPPAIGEDGQDLNVDGDRAAGWIASAMKAGTLVILSDVPGLLRSFPDPGSLVKDLDLSELEEAAERWAEGRMRIKLLGAREAIERGVERVILGDSRLEHPVRAALAGAGTVIRRGVGR